MCLRPHWSSLLRLRRCTAGGMRGLSASVTVIRTPAAGTTIRLCDVSGDESTTCEKGKLMAGRRAIEIQIGAVMPDGTVYAGISPDTGQAMYTTPGDVGRTFGREKAQAFNWEDAMNYAARFDGHSQKDWRVPTLLKVSHVAAAPLLSPLGASWTCCLRTARPSEGSRNPALNPSAGTGPPRSTTTTRRGLSASATGTSSTSTSRTPTRLCAVSARDQKSS